MSAVTQNEYTQTDTTTVLRNFTFPYLKTSDIKVSLDGVETTAFTLANATTIQFNTAPSNGAKIKIFRQTGVDDLTATFYAGSAIKSEDLNDNFTQNLYKTQEVGERFISNLGGTMTGDLNMGENTVIKFEGATDNAHETTLTVADPTADRTITFPNVTGNVVTTGDTGTVATGMIAADAVTGAKIADDQINSEHYVDGSIDTQHIADAQVTTAKIADSNVTTGKLAADAVTAAKLADNAVVTANIVDANVTTAKIAADAVNGTKIADNSIDSEHYVDGSIDSAHIATNAVTNIKMADDSVGTAELQDSSVDTARLADNSVTLAKMVDNSVGTSEVVDAAVTTAKIADNAVTMAKLAGGTLPSDIAVVSANITDGTIATVDLADNSVTTAKIADAELSTLAGMQSGTASKLADSTALTADIADLNQIDGLTKQTTISDSDASFPTSGAVVDYVAAQIAPLGGLEVIATEVAFPNTQPSAGVVISISDAGGVVFNGSGTSTTGRTVGGSTVTINNAPSSLNSETLVAGVGLMVSSTGSSQIYNYHKILGKEDDIKQLSDDINDFNARYRVGSSNPTSALDAGDLFFNTSTQKLLVYNSTNSAWEEAQSIGNFFISTFSEAFDGSRTQFTLSNAPTNVQQIILSLNGVVQKPGTAFTLSGSTVTLASAPASGTDYFAVVMGSTVNIGQPSNNTVTTAVLQNSSVTTAKIADDAVTAAKLAADAVVTTSMVDDAVTAAKLAADAVVTTSMVDDAVTAAKLAADAVVTASMVDDAVTAAKLASNTVVNASVDASAAIAGTKISPNFGSQNIVTTGGLTVDTTTLKVDASNNRVGVGTASPDKTLHISGTSSGDISAKIENTFSSDATRFAILQLKSGIGSVRFHDQGDTLEGEIRYDSTNNFMSFATNGNSERMRIDSSGKVGIGTTSPTFSSFGSNTGGLEISDVDTNNALLIQSGSNELFIANTPSANYIFGDDDAPLIIATNGTEAMRIKNNQNVGIGTNSPLSKLHVQSGSITEGSIMIGANYDGVGLANNSDKSSAINAPMYDSDTFPNGVRLLSHYSNNTTTLLQLGGGTNSARAATSILFYTAPDKSSNGVEQARLTAGGRLGIGISPESGGGKIQIRPAHNFQDSATSLESSGDKAVVRVRTSNNSSLSLYIGGLDDSIDSARPYLQAGNRSTNGPTASYDIYLCPFGGNVRTRGILPKDDNSHDLGTSANRWDDVFATNGTINTSDRNEKNTIVDSDLGLSFINKLKPVSYKFNSGTRIHYGLISQDVETVLSDISKPTTDFAGFIKSELSDELYTADEPLPTGKKVGDVKTSASIHYGLRYGEFIAPLIKAVQELSITVETLKTKVAALEAA